MMAGWDSYEVTVSEPDKKYEARSFKGADGLNTVLIKFSCDGLTEEQWSRWSADPSVVSAAVN